MGIPPARRTGARTGADVRRDRAPEVLARWAVLAPEPLAVVTLDLAGPVLAWVNEALAGLFGYGTADLAGAPLSMLVDGPYARASADLAGVELRASHSVTSHVDGIRSDGTGVAVRVEAVPVGTAEERAWVLSVRPESAPDAGAELRASEERFRALAERAPIATFFSDGGLRLGYVNDRFAKLLGVPVPRLLGTGWMSALDEGVREALAEALETTLQGVPTETPIAMPVPHGGLRWLLVRAEPVTTAGRAAGFVGTAEDITQRRAYEARLAHQAMHDPLTGLPNRTHLWATVGGALDETDGGGRATLALLFLDLDNFKLVNDSLGHDAGDQLLVATAARLAAVMREGDVVSRFGGDEFVVVARGVRTDAHAMSLADRIRSVVSEPVEVGGVIVHPSTSIGIVRVEPRHATAADLVRDADIAMYEAKRGGKNRQVLLDNDARATLADRLGLLTELSQAVEQGEIQVHYQPVVTLPDGGVTGVEALARWTHPQRGAVPPQDFVALAEEGGLIGALGRCVLREAISAIAALRRRSPAAVDLTVAVNLSAEQLSDETLADFVCDLLAEHDLPPSALCLEVTETMLMTDSEAAVETFSRLRGRGVSIAVDDFGTGYSCLAYLRHLPVDVLKLDRAFVCELDDGNAAPGALAVAEAVTALATGLGLRSVGEGVETPEQARLLAEAGCTHAQGWLYAKAMPVRELERFLEESAR